MVKIDLWVLVLELSINSSLSGPPVVNLRLERNSFFLVSIHNIYSSSFWSWMWTHPISRRFVDVVFKKRGVNFNIERLAFNIREMRICSVVFKWGLEAESAVDVVLSVAPGDASIWILFSVEVTHRLITLHSVGASARVVVDVARSRVDNLRFVAPGVTPIFISHSIISAYSVPFSCSIIVQQAKSAQSSISWIHLVL